MCPTLCIHVDSSRPGFPVPYCLLKSAQTHVHWIGNDVNHLILCHLFLFLSLIFPRIRIFSNKSALCIRWSNFWSFSFNISPSNEYSGLMSTRIYWFDLLAVQGTSLPARQFESINSAFSLLYVCFFMYASLWCSLLYVCLHSYPYIATRKTTALNMWTFVSKVMPLLFNTLSRFAIAFLPRSKHLLFWWLQSQSAVILEPKKIKSAIISNFSHMFAMKWWNWMPWS